MKTHLSEHCLLLKNIMEVTSGMTKSQAERILKNYERANADKDLRCLRALHISDMEDEQFMRPYDASCSSRAGIDGLWAVLTIVSDSEGVPNVPMLETIMKGKNLIDFSFIYRAKAVVNVIHLDEGETVKVAAIKQRYHDYMAEESSTDTVETVHLFVTEYPEMVKVVSDAKLNFKYRIALIEGDITSNPTVNLLK